MTVRFLLYALPTSMLVSLCGCDNTPAPKDPISPSRAATPTDVELLRSLPYIGYSEEKAEAGRNGVYVWDKNRTYPGYNLCCSTRLCLVELIDPTGQVIHAWQFSPCYRWDKFTLFPNGDLLVAAKYLPAGIEHPREEDRQQFLETLFLLKLSWHGEVIWKSAHPVHHDVEITPRDHILTLTTIFRRIPAINAQVDIRDDFIALFSLDGTPLDEISLCDVLHAHPPFTFASRKINESRNEIDLLHSNSTEWMRHEHLATKHPIYAPSNVLVCIRHQDTIAVIDWDKKKTIWTWGQGMISGPHDATVLENGHILLFDNGLDRGWSRVLELDPVTEKIAWEYKAPHPPDFFCTRRGTNQRLPNGNTLIANSDRGHAFEVTSEGKTVWEYYNPHLNEEGYRATISQVKRYEASYIEDILKRF